MKTSKRLQGLLGYAVVALGVFGLYWLVDLLNIDPEEAYLKAATPTGPRWVTYGPSGTPAPLFIDEHTKTILPPDYVPFPPFDPQRGF